MYFLHIFIIYFIARFRITKLHDLAILFHRSSQVLVKEEDRLAAVIDEIDREVHIVPRGSYVKTATSKIVSNRSFEGLNNLDCKKLCSYFHFRNTPNTDKIKLLAKVTKLP